MTIDSLDPMQMLCDVLSRKVTKKIEAQIRERVAANKCLCCGEKPIVRDGNCRSCDHQVSKATASMTPRKRVEFMTGLYADGLRLRPYEIAHYRKPETELMRRARGA
jgi:predicted RNA-binding Zn-ribbon protein involved in translation (DUF1610 family)